MASVGGGETMAFTQMMSESESEEMAPTREIMISEETESIKNELFHLALKGEWEEVVKKYRSNPVAQTVKIINRSGDTALHIAVSDGQEEIVKELVKILISNGPEGKEALAIENELGNTPLHVAALLGSVGMCECIAQVDPSLVGARNKETETPFFLAALHGQKQAFLCLLQIRGREDCEGYSRKTNDGETILHVAIAGDYFDLAFQIIHLYKNLVNSVNQEGLSPFHLLADKPSAFKSGSHFGRYNKIIYYCILVDELQLDPTIVNLIGETRNPKDDQKPDKKSHNNKETTNNKNSTLKCPKNYRTCVSFFQLFWNVVRHVKIQGENGANSDLERDPGSQVTNGSRGHTLFPRNYVTCFEFVKLAHKAVLVLLGLGHTEIGKIQAKKQKHIWSVQIMNELLPRASMNESDNTGTTPAPPPTKQEDDQTQPYSITEDSVTYSNLQQMPKSPTHESLEANQNDKKKESEGQVKNGEVAGKDKSPERAKNETIILIAAKNGITEIVEKILERFPIAIHDVNSEKKNIVLLAVEHRQPHVYQLLVKRNILRDSVFRVVDNQGNSALHLAAKLGNYKPRLIAGAVLQMQWEIKWYEFVKESMPLNFFPRYNKERKTPKDLFTETHRDLIEKGSDWINKTSESCSVVAALIATVAFTTSSTVPGGVKADSGTPTLEKHPPFQIFAIFSLVALCFSVIAVIMFLAILTSQYQERDFGKYLPAKVLVSLTLLFVSIASMLISFCAGHSFMLKDELKYAAFPVYAVTCLLVMFFVMVQFPLYFELISVAFEKVPSRRYKAVPL